MKKQSKEELQSYSIGGTGQLTAGTSVQKLVFGNEGKEKTAGI